MWRSAAAYALSFDNLSHALTLSKTGATQTSALYASQLCMVYNAVMVLTEKLN